MSAAGGAAAARRRLKPRTSPYTFGGLGAEGLELLCRAGRETGLPVVSEITDPRQLPLFREVDVLQVGARNMQNFELLRELGRREKPVLLKRSFGATVTELLQAAEYILAGGNERVILCERGIRTFETDSRATLDVAGIAALKEQSHLPVLADPSHAAGRRELVAPLALAAAAAGADGLMIEVHDRPEEALSDGRQAPDLRRICPTGPTGAGTDGPAAAGGMTKGEQPSRRCREGCFMRKGPGGKGGSKPTISRRRPGCKRNFLREEISEDCPMHRGRKGKNLDDSAGLTAFFSGGKIGG